MFPIKANQARRSIDEIHQKIVGNRTMLQRQSTITKSLRVAHPKINVPESIFGDASKIFTASEFEFDDTVINSKAYLRALAVARFKSSSSKPSIQADLKVEKSNGIALVKLNKPDKLNAVDEGLFGDLDRIWQQLAQDEEVNVIVLTGEGRAFSAGGDVKGMAARAGTGGPWAPGHQHTATKSAYNQAILVGPRRADRQDAGSGA